MEVQVEVVGVEPMSEGATIALLTTADEDAAKVKVRVSVYTTDAELIEQMTVGKVFTLTIA